MKILVDENLPRTLVSWLSARGHEATHVVDVGLSRASDAHVWSAALAQNVAILTRDTDFLELARNSSGGGVVRLAIGNCTTATLLTWLESVWPTVVSRWDAGERVIEAQ